MSHYVAGIGVQGRCEAALGYFNMTHVAGIGVQDRCEVALGYFNMTHYVAGIGVQGRCEAALGYFNMTHYVAGIGVQGRCEAALGYFNMTHVAGIGVQGRCEAALDALHKVQTSFTAVKGSKLFTARKKCLSSDFSHAFLHSKSGLSPTINSGKMSISYTHQFFCLSQCKQEVVPTTNREKDALLEAGLSEKKILVPDIDMTGEEFRNLILQEFPKLKDGGVFVFAKCANNSRVLEPLSSFCLTSPRRLRDRVGNSRTFVLPLQNDLSLKSVIEISPGVSVKAFTVMLFYSCVCVFFRSLWRCV